MIDHKIVIGKKGETYNVLYIETKTEIPHWGPPQTRDVKEIVLFSSLEENACDEVLRAIFKRDTLDSDDNLIDGNMLIRMILNTSL